MRHGGRSAVDAFSSPGPISAVVPEHQSLITPHPPCRVPGRPVLPVSWQPTAPPGWQHAAEAGSRQHAWYWAAAAAQPPPPPLLPPCSAPGTNALGLADGTAVLLTQWAVQTRPASEGPIIDDAAGTAQLFYLGVGGGQPGGKWGRVGMGQRLGLNAAGAAHHLYDLLHTPPVPCCPRPPCRTSTGWMIPLALPPPARSVPRSGAGASATAVVSAGTTATPGTAPTATRGRARLLPASATPGWMCCCPGPGRLAPRRRWPSLAWEAPSSFSAPLAALQTTSTSFLRCAERGGRGGRVGKAQHVRRTCSRGAAMPLPSFPAVSAETPELPGAPAGRPERLPRHCCGSLSGPQSHHPHCWPPPGGHGALPEALLGQAQPRRARAAPRPPRPRALAVPPVRCAQQRLGCGQGTCALASHATGSWPLHRHPACHALPAALQHLRRAGRQVRRRHPHRLLPRCRSAARPEVCA